MNTNDLPPAAKLAALIEAGRAANPDLKQGRGELLRPERHEACALGFACLALGASRASILNFDFGFVDLEERYGFKGLVDFVYKINDGGASLDEICASLREGELAKVAA